jgi:peptide/nickel transport system substrate-binding protein
MGETALRWSRIAAVVLLGLLASSGPAAADPPPANILEIELAADIDYVDPALSFYFVTWQIEYATCAKLVNYPDRPAPEGARLEPEVASGMPTVSPDGRTYTFQLRTGFTFSPGSEPLNAHHFEWAIERMLHPSVNSPGQRFFADLESVTAVGDHTLVFVLDDPAGDFLARLAMPFTCPLPLSVPPNPDGIHAPVPSAGPYYIASWDPNVSIVVKENPHYSGPRPHNFDEIHYAIGADVNTIQARITSGETDLGDVAPDTHDALSTQYGPGSSPAASGRQRWFAYPSPTVLFLVMNHDRPLFGDDDDPDTDLDPLGNVALKQAVNHAIDRTAMVAKRGATGGVPTDQLLPFGMPGFRDEALYPETSDLVQARQLAGCAGDTPDTCPQRAGVLYCSNRAPAPEICQDVRTRLLAINLNMTVVEFPRVIQFQRTGTRGEAFDMTLEGWFQDYYDPYNFLFLLDGRRLGPVGSQNNANMAYFNDSGFNAKLDAADALAGTERTDALGDLDVETARDVAPWAPYAVPNNRYFFSDRIGCQTHVPAYTISLGALCLRAPAPPPPPPPPPAPPPPPPSVRPPAQAVRCVVPNVRGRTVARARRMLSARRCALGRVRRAYSARMGRGKIVSQSRRPGARLRRGTRVNVVVSRGRRRR